MTILLTHTSQWLETGTTGRQQDATADQSTEPKAQVTCPEHHGTGPTSVVR
jgi:hypothetical protein